MSKFSEYLFIKPSIKAQKYRRLLKYLEGETYAVFGNKETNEVITIEIHNSIKDLIDGQK